MEKPECPECKEEMLVQERYITASYVDELEMGDPSMPNPGDRQKEWADEEYHPHYWCPKCNKYFNFSLDPLHPLIAGQHNQEHWHNDIIQFSRLLSEMQADTDVQTLAAGVAEAMSLEWDLVYELFDRATEKWEQYKEAITPPPVNKKDVAATIMHEEMEKALKIIDKRLQARNIYAEEVTDALATNIDGVGECLHAGDFDLEPE